MSRDAQLRHLKVCATHSSRNDEARIASFAALLHHCSPMTGANRHE